MNNRLMKIYFVGFRSVFVMVIKCGLLCKVEIILEQREVAFLSPNKLRENLNFSTEIQIFENFAG